MASNKTQSPAQNAVYVLGGGNSVVETQIKTNFDTGVTLFRQGKVMPVGDTEEIKVQQLGWKFERRQELDYELQLATISESYQRIEVNARIRVWR